LYICYVFKEHLKHKTEDIPDDWVCPLCGVGKDDFEVQED